MVAAMTEGRARLCQTLTEFTSCDGESVCLRGFYRSASIRQKGTAQRSPGDHAYIRLSDGAETLLSTSWAPEGRRTTEEIRRFENQLVEVEGIAHAKSPKPPQDIAYIVGPCVSPVVAIRLAQPGIDQ